MEVGKKHLIEKAIKEIEAKSSCELVALFTQRSSHYIGLPIYLVPKFLRHKVSKNNANKHFKNILEQKNNKVMMFFVSLDEKYASILTDKEISLENKIWQDIIDNFIEDVKNGHIEDAYLNTIEKAKDILIKHFPNTSSDSDELPNNLTVV